MYLLFILAFSGLSYYTLIALSASQLLYPSRLQMIMLPKTHISFVAFAILAVKIARASADAYDRSESEGYSTPYIPSQDGSEQDTPTDGADIPSSTSSSFQEEPTNEGYQPEELNTVPSSTRTSSRPSNTPNGNRNENGNGKRYTPVIETLSDGSSYQKGSFNSSLKWQSTGVLKHGMYTPLLHLQIDQCADYHSPNLGGCPVDAMIGDCYSMYLDSDGMLEPMEDKSSPRKSKRHHPRQLIPPPQDDEDPYHHSLGVDSPHHYFKQLAATIGTGGPIDDPTTADMNNWKVMASSGKPPCKAQGGAKDNEPPAPRQRLEFLSWPPAPARETWDYAWRTYIDDRTTTTSKWWHM